MFARRVSMQVKPGGIPALAEKLESSVLPLLRRQPGFREDVVLVARGGTEVYEISLWDSQESAEAFGREIYPEVTRLLEAHVDGPHKVRSYEVAFSSFDKSAADMLK